MLRSEGSKRIIHCDICKVRLPGPAVAIAEIRTLTGRAKLHRWRVERRAGTWQHVCPAHPAEKQGKML